MEPRYYDDDQDEDPSEVILREVAATGRSEGWCMRAGTEREAGAVEVRLRSFDIGYVDDMRGTWARVAGGSTFFWPPIAPPLAPAETRRRIAALAPADRCCDDCPTYFIGERHGATATVRCDECWTRVPEAERVDDDDVAALPEAQVALMARIVEEQPDIFGPAAAA